MNQKDESPGKSAERFILIGEDDVDDQELLHEMFTAADAETKLKFVTNGKKLLDELDGLADNQLPCLIILDYNMP